MGAAQGATGFSDQGAFQSKGIPDITGVGVQTLSKISQSGSGNLVFSGLGVQTLPKISQNFQAQLAFKIHIRLEGSFNSTKELEGSFGYNESFRGIA